VICVDHDEQKVAALKGGRLPFYEPELSGILHTQLNAGRLYFETSIARAMPKADLVFLAIGTPAQADGSPNLDNLLRCVHELSATAFGDCIVVVKSTVPVGTGDRIESLLNENRALCAGHPRVRVASNPEFLAEGRAVRDFRHPDRIVIGANDSVSASVLAQLYSAFDPQGERLMSMDRRSAEFAKYACNAMLAARISMVNELAALAGSMGADIDAICKVLKGDPRIGASYLHPGVGYGGSCLPKDLRALINTAQRIGEPADMLRSVQRVNQRQVRRLLGAIHQHFAGELKGKRIAVWGLSFKPGTDDMRAAPSLALIRRLLDEGASVFAYDPVAMNAARLALGNVPVTFGQSALGVCEDADALVLMTEWDEFKAPEFAALAARMRGSMIFDARSIYRAATLREYGLSHYQLGECRLRHTSAESLSLGSAASHQTSEEPAEDRKPYS
jgi:UDPglucose 6-dehydrogenase